MIVTRIDIENFKQYQGEHSFDVPDHATVGVIGENGAGKTTLFESLEWCLYGPKSMSASDIRPRNTTGHTTVRVYLSSTSDQTEYVVERVLRKTASSTIYRVDGDGSVEPIVQGPTQVTDYVSTKLIGLAHKAFTATFFTRQKELHLFGSETPGKRREEVGRLLGLETIRHAHTNVVKQKSQATATAKALKAQYERESDNRNLSAELAQANDSISSLTAARLAANSTMTTAIDAREAAEKANLTALNRREQDTTFAHLIDSVKQDRAAQELQRNQIVAQLTRLEHRERERGPLQEEAGLVPGLQQSLTDMELQRTRFERRAELDRLIHDANQRLRDGNATVRDLVNGVHLAHQVDGWLWSTDDTLNTQSGIKRLLTVASVADVDAAEATVTTLKQVVEMDRRYVSERQKLEQYKTRQQELIQKEQAFLANGDPNNQIPRLDVQREKLLHHRSTADAQRTAAEGDRDRTRKILGNLEHEHIDGNCPTCGRAFSRDDADLVRTTLRNSMTQLSETIDGLVSSANADVVAIANLEEERKRAFKQIDELAAIRSSLEKSVTFLESQQQATLEAETERRAALSTANREEVPTVQQIEEAQRVATQMRDLRSTRQTLNASAKTFEAIDAHIANATTERASLADVTFDATEFGKLRESLARAIRSEATLRAIESELARRPELEQERIKSETSIAEISERLEVHQAQRLTLAYASGEFESAQETLVSAQEAERRTTSEVHRAEAALRDAEHRRDGVVNEQKRLNQLALQSEASQSQADTLDMMAKEFTEFERYAAARKLPILADLTSHLVESITNGRYDRVEFDQNFGIVVFDGSSSDASYPISTFSGGERDAIILAARVAMSHMIGRQAVNPPSFMVLDEVFGSLDAARRNQLMDTLGSITRSFDELRQIFIISHVDDVRTSPVLDELWRIEEVPGGGSVLTSLPPGSDIDTL